MARLASNATPQTPKKVAVNGWQTPGSDDGSQSSWSPDTKETIHSPMSEAFGSLSADGSATAALDFATKRDTCVAFCFGLI